MRHRIGAVLSRAAPMEEWSFLDARTFFLSMFIGAIIGAWIGGAVVASIVGIVIYVVAAVHPRNVTTCRWCGTHVNARASVCRACGRDL